VYAEVYGPAEKQEFSKPFLLLPRALLNVAGAKEIAELPPNLKGSEPEVQRHVLELVRPNLSPELWNRIDETVVFNRLQRENMDIITDMGLKRIADRLEESQSMTLDVSASAKSVLSEMGYDVRYGARPLKRTLTRALLNPLSRLILSGEIVSGDTVYVRTRAEAEKAQQQSKYLLGWIATNSASDNKNDVVIIRNHKAKPEEEEVEGGEEEKWDDNHLLLEERHVS
jgi:C-terminal, D2-small domain, of ClpB protein